MRNTLRLLLLSITLLAGLFAHPAAWIDLVLPAMTTAEHKIYLSLSPDAQAKFRENFWSTKSITAEEYFRRLQYIDSTYGSSKITSGANTDPGRVYLSLGPPNRITRLPSSRIFVPLEIWYYEASPAAHLNTELRIIFYQKNSLGLPRLYSPTLDTLRVLLLPEPGTQGMFGPNDTLDESTIRKNLNVGPVEDEVVSAAVGVASGVTGTGNDEILARITSPGLALNREQHPDVKSRFLVSHPQLDVLQTPSRYGATQVDLSVNVAVRGTLRLEVRAGSLPVYANQLHLNFPSVRTVQYLQRLDLLPGEYSVLISTDGTTHPYPLHVTEKPVASAIVRASPQPSSDSRHTPFEFAGQHFRPDNQGRIALVSVIRPGTVTWIIRRSFEVVWKTSVEAQQVALLSLPLDQLPPGSYQLEAVTPDSDSVTDLVLSREESGAALDPLLSFNANLAPPDRYTAVAHQLLLRGDVVHARTSLEASLGAGSTAAAQIELARIAALTGDLDGARDRLRIVLAAEPQNFAALSVFAYVETRFQDYAVAADLYRRALAVQESPALRAALNRLPAR